MPHSHCIHGHFHYHIHMYDIKKPFGIHTITLMAKRLYGVVFRLCSVYVNWIDRSCATIRKYSFIHLYSFGLANGNIMWCVMCLTHGAALICLRLVGRTRWFGVVCSWFVSCICVLLSEQYATRQLHPHINWFIWICIPHVISSETSGGAGGTRENFNAALQFNCRHHASSATTRWSIHSSSYFVTRVAETAHVLDYHFPIHCVCRSARKIQHAAREARAIIDNGIVRTIIMCLLFLLCLWCVQKSLSHLSALH